MPADRAQNPYPLLYHTLSKIASAAPIISWGEPTRADHFLGGTFLRKGSPQTPFQRLLTAKFPYHIASRPYPNGIRFRAIWYGNFDVRAWNRFEEIFRRKIPQKTPVSFVEPIVGDAAPGVPQISETFDETKCRGGYYPPAFLKIVRRNDISNPSGTAGHRNYEL